MNPHSSAACPRLYGQFEGEHVSSRVVPAPLRAAHYGLGLVSPLLLAGQGFRQQRELSPSPGVGGKGGVLSRPHPPGAWGNLRAATRLMPTLPAPSPQVGVPGEEGLPRHRHLPTEQHHHQSQGCDLHQHFGAGGAALGCC